MIIMKSSEECMRQRGRQKVWAAKIEVEWHNQCRNSTARPKLKQCKWSSEMKRLGRTKSQAKTCYQWRHGSERCTTMNIHRAVTMNIVLRYLTFVTLLWGTSLVNWNGTMPNTFSHSLKPGWSLVFPISTWNKTS